MAQQTLFVQNQILPRVRRHFDDAGVHANRIFGARFDTIAAEHAHAEINVEFHRDFLNFFFGTLAGDDINAFRRANGFAHHARDAAWRAVFTLRQAVHRAQARMKQASYIGILKRDRALPLSFHTEAGQREVPQIAEEMVRRDFQSVPNAREIGVLPKSERFVFVVNVHGFS